MRADEIIKEHFEQSFDVHRRILSNPDFLKSVSESAMAIAGAIKNGKKLLVAGNGGSAGDAQHIVAELVGRFEKEREPFPAIALTTNTSTITAVSNDYSFETIFSRQLLALGQKGDVFLGISTSGNSKNIVSAFRVAKELGVKSIGLLGNNGGKCVSLCDIAIIVPHKRTARIQEIHILAIHAVCDFVEKELSAKKQKT